MRPTHPATAFWRWVLCPLLLGVIEGGIVWTLLHAVEEADPTRAVIIGSVIALVDFVFLGVFMFIWDTWLVVIWGEERDDES